MMLNIQMSMLLFIQVKIGYLKFNKGTCNLVIKKMAWTIEHMTKFISSPSSLIAIFSFTFTSSFNFSKRKLTATIPHTNTIKRTKGFFPLKQNLLSSSHDLDKKKLEERVTKLKNDFLMIEEKTQFAMHKNHKVRLQFFTCWREFHWRRMNLILHLTCFRRIWWC